MRPIGIEEVLRTGALASCRDSQSPPTGDSQPPEYGGVPSMISQSRTRDSLMRLHELHGVPNVDAFFQSVGTTVAAILPEDVQVTFQLDGEGGGTWTVARTTDGVEVRPGPAIWADSVLACSVTRFVDLITGHADPEQAFAQGQLRIEGDLGLLLRLRQALPVAA